MLEAGDEESVEAAKKGCDWLIDRQILEVKGDWIKKAPDLRPGGWAFQYWNDYYPDVDDTAVVGMAMHRTGSLACNLLMEGGALLILIIIKTI